MRNHLLIPGRLLNDKGYLNEAGYATSLVKKYNRKDIKAAGCRIKEWDYYLVYNNEFGIAFTIDDNAYMGLAGVSFINFVEKKEKTINLMTPFPMGKTKMPSTSEYGDTIFHNSRLQMKFLKDGSKRTLLLDMDQFDNSKKLKARIQLTMLPNQESMVIATPFLNHPKAFYYNQKIIGMYAEGEVEYGDQVFVFKPENSFGLLDWGRGVWTYNNTWYWGAGHGIIDGKIFGFNIGYGFGDISAASENMIFYNGKAHKLDDILFVIPKDKKGCEQYEKPWKFKSSDGRFEMDFEPVIDRKSFTTTGVISSDQHQVFGKFSGIAVLEDGKILELKDFLGFAEKVKNKW